MGKRIVRESHSNEPPYADEKYMTYLCNLISSAYENSRGRLSRIDFSAKRIGGVEINWFVFSKKRNDDPGVTHRLSLGLRLSMYIYMNL